MSTRKPPGRNRSKPPRKRPGAEGGIRATNRRDVTERLIDGAIHLFLAEGIESVTIDELVARAGIAKGSFYRYARDKAELVAMIFLPVGDEVIAAIDRCEQALSVAHRDTLAATYVRLAAELSAVIAKYAMRVRLYLQEARSPATESRRPIHVLADELAERGVALTKIARKHGLIREVDPRVSALSVLGAIEALLFDHLRQRGGDPTRAVTELVAIVLGGITPR